MSILPLEQIESVKIKMSAAVKSMKSTVDNYVPKEESDPDGYRANYDTLFNILEQKERETEQLTNDAKVAITRLKEIVAFSKQYNRLSNTVKRLVNRGIMKGPSNTLEQLSRQIIKKESLNTPFPAFKTVINKSFNGGKSTRKNRSRVKKIQQKY